MFTIDHHGTNIDTVWALPDTERSTRRHQHWLAAVFGIITTLIVIAALYYLITCQNTDTDENGCLVDTEPSNVVEFFIDQSDPFPANVGNLIKDEVRRHTRQLGIGDMISLSRLDANSPTWKVSQEFGNCRPKRGEDVTIWTGNPEEQEKIYQRNFIAPLLAALDTALEPINADQSPLI